MSNSKKFKRWVDELVDTLVSAFGLELEGDRRNKYRVIKGRINGQPYKQRFSNTPKSYTKASQSIISETRRKLQECGFEIPQINQSLPNFNFLTYENLEQREKYEKLVKLLSENSMELDEYNMTEIDIESFWKEIHKSYSDSDVHREAMNSASEVEDLLGSLGEILSNISYDDLLDELSSANGEDRYQSNAAGFRNVNIIPGEKMQVHCEKILLAMASGTSSRRGFTGIMRKVRRHLIDCFHRTKFVIILTDVWDPKKFDESRKDIESHRRRGIIFLPGLVSGGKITAVSLPF